jgi:hypothetical protein
MAVMRIKTYYITYFILGAIFINASCLFLPAPILGEGEIRIGLSDEELQQKFNADGEKAEPRLSVPEMEQENVQPQQTPHPARLQKSRETVNKVILSPSQKNIAKRLLLEAEMLDLSDSSEKDSYNLSQRVILFEQLAALYCMPQLQSTLSYSGPPTGKECFEYLDSLTKLHSNNAIATCIRNGIDSQLCREAYAKRITTTLSPNAPGTYGEPDVDFQVAESNTERSASSLIAELNSEIKMHELAKSTRETYKNIKNLPDNLTALPDESDEDFSERLALQLEKAIPDTCNIRKEVLAIGPLPQSFLRELKVDSKNESDNELMKLLAEYSKPTQHTIPKRSNQVTQNNITRSHHYKKSSRHLGRFGRRSQLSHTTVDHNNAIALDSDSGQKQEKDKIRQMHRIRYLTSGCMRLIEWTLAKYPQNISAICSRDGETSPSCITARRSARTVNSHQPEATERQSMLDTF